MESKLPQAQALALSGDTIVAVGSDQEIIALRGSDTEMIDLGGRALLPGFVDPHTHPFGSVSSVESLEAGQQRTLERGTTTIGDTFVSPPKLDRIMLALESTSLRLRTSLYLAYNDKCNGLLDEGWILDHSPIVDPTLMLRIPGVKIIADPAGPNISCGWAAMSVPLPAGFADARGAGPYGEDLFSEEEMAQVIAQYQAEGFQVIIHTRGDVTVDTVLSAIESALAGSPIPCAIGSSTTTSSDRIHFPDMGRSAPYPPSGADLSPASSMTTAVSTFLEWKCNLGSIVSAL